MNTVLKTYFYSHTVSVMSILSFGCYFAFSYFMYLAERDTKTLFPGMEEKSHIETFFDAVWFTGVSMTTCGYGDFSPVSHLGRVVAFSATVCGRTLLSIPKLVTHMLCR